MRIQSILLGLFMQDEFIDQQAKKVEKDKKQQIYKVYDKKVLEELPEDYRKDLNNRFDTHKMRIKIYFPLLFKQLRQKDSKYINVKKNFDLIENLKSLQNIAETGDGGRSGELLFFNHDNSLLMKTISHQDVLSFQKIGKHYFDYVINKNPDTLISKIYGMYSFTRKDARDSKTYIIFMRNIANIPSSSILRRYDLKGSRFDREVLIKMKIKAEEMPNYTNIEEFDNQYKHGNDKLKFIQNMDINDVSYSTDSRSADFEDKQVVTSNQLHQVKNNNQLQPQQSTIKSKSTDSQKYSFDINVNQIHDWTELYNQPIYQLESSLSLHKSLKQNVNIAKITMKDLDFVKLEKQVFIEQKSLDQIKINLEKDSLFFKQNGLIDYSLLIFKVVKREENTEEDIENHIFESTKEKYVFYHIGIIDYLQQWNIDKLLEQKAKQAIHANLKLNVSSQNPETYQSRFKQNIIDSFF